jgi:hypothetical protein
MVDMGRGVCLAGFLEKLVTLSALKELGLGAGSFSERDMASFESQVVVDAPTFYHDALPS